MWVSRLTGIVPIIGLITLMATGASAAAEGWIVESARGTALQLNGDQWEEIEPGETVADGAIFRTLQSGRLVLRNGGSVVSLGGKTAVEIDVEGAGATVHQFAGAVTIIADSPSRAIEVRNGALVASATGTTFTVRFDGKKATVEVEEGEVKVADAATGRVIVADAGDTVVASAAGLEASGTDMAGVETAGAAASENGNAGGGADGNNGSGAGAGAGGNGNNGNGAGAGGNNGNGNGGNGNNGNGNNGNGNGNNGNNGNGQGNGNQ
jgi:hypothetical protein